MRPALNTATLPTSAFFALLLLACGKNSGRIPVPGNGTEPEVSVEQTPAPDSDSDAADDGADDGSDDGAVDTGDTDHSDIPKVHELVFSCSTRIVRIDINDLLVESFIATGFSTTDKSGKTSSGVFHFLVPGDLKPHALGISTKKELSPGEAFTGDLVVYRGSESPLYSCPAKRGDNYFRYITGNTSLPSARHFEGVVFNLYNSPDCSGPVVVKKYSFCINAVNAD